ncbi:hypothetical protein L6164_004480 [Bauhinia variegata]|uniref:Uncharacterized protein n=1 Tax=Bauhinia variegata TaxID=167791 RepID=A0ACB9Q4H8_BAUVA|nr:hypothetical protein L6164_004480 [Bauhinia variegata]
MLWRRYGLLQFPTFSLTVYHVILENVLPAMTAQLQAVRSALCCADCAASSGSDSHQSTVENSDLLFFPKLRLLIQRTVWKIQQNYTITIDSKEARIMSSVCQNNEQSK